MSRQFTLESPFVEYTFSDVPEHWKAILVAWVVFWVIVVIALTYLYSVVFADWVGFETTLLVGVFLLLMSMGARE